MVIRWFRGGVMGSGASDVYIYFFMSIHLYYI